MASPFKDSLRLPKTDFPMRGDLARREPDFLRVWDETRVYERLLEQNAGHQRFVFHDGPPYANGNIHLGHVLNKVLKDVVVKLRSMQGRLCRYVPGWDCHGLPIELGVDKSLGPKKAEMTTVAFRRECRAEAERWIAVQKGEFRRLGCFATWDEPYLTMDPSYEAAIVRGLGAFVGAGLVYRGKKPVHWCATDRTALAELEVEYKNKSSHSIYVRFAVADRQAVLETFGLADDGAELSVLIWTTTPWTLPANRAIALHPAYRYRVLKVGVEKWIVAEDLAGAVKKACRALGTFEGGAVLGAALEGTRTRHPFYDRDSPLVVGDHVTLEAGTGAVHTAPGHGHDDYVIGVRCGLPIDAPVDDAGAFTADAAPWTGTNVFAANDAIVEALRASGRLASDPKDRIEHSYPHCWRCRNPVIFRSTEQWFISMDEGDLRKRALEAIEKVDWIPPWGRDRIHGMIAARPDWCISRQRTWGVPIPAFHCEGCGQAALTAATCERAAEIFAREGADAWFARDAGDLVPEGLSCAKCGGTAFRKDNDILDVWFESGISWLAVCAEGKDLGLPIDLYLEGSDQHRGWFHSALLTGIGVSGSAPYRAVLTHGFVLDEKGQPYSKSLKNYVPPQKVIAERGAEIFRLWAAYEDYRGDVAFSQSHLEQVADSYRKVRNTFRFLLGNLTGFDPARAIATADLGEVDRWLCARLAQHVDKVLGAYDRYDFRTVWHASVEFASVDLSALYLDVAKDRLYTEAGSGRKRTSAQTVLHGACDALARTLAPILSFTAEEVWSMLPKASGASDSVFLAGMPAIPAAWRDDALLARWETILRVRGVATKALEEARQRKEIGSSLEAKLVISAPGDVLAVLEPCQGMLADVFLVSGVSLAAGDAIAAVVAPADGVRCARCWCFRPDVGARTAEVCARCAAVLAGEVDS